MFSWLKGITVEEVGNTVIVSGLRTNALEKIISKIWGTSVINTYMVKRHRSNAFKFERFFTIDVIYILERIMQDKRNILPKRDIVQIIELLKERTWFKDIDNNQIKDRLDFKRLNDFNYNPKPFQQTMFEYYSKTLDRYHLNGMLLHGTPGSGKTFMGAAMMWMAHVDKVIVICPWNALISVWETDINKAFKHPPKIWTTASSGKPDADTFYNIYHYEAIQQALTNHEEDFKRGLKIGLILDESHNFNDTKSQRTQKWLELTQRSNSLNIIHASGTPFKALGSESIPLFKAIDPFFSKEAEEAFKKVYGSSAQRGLDILKNRLGLVSFVITKDELGLDKPIMHKIGVKIKDGSKYTLDAVKQQMQIYIQERVAYYKARAEEDDRFYTNCIVDATTRGDKEQKCRIVKYLTNVKKIKNCSRYSEVKAEMMECKVIEKEVIEPLLNKEDVKAFRSVVSVIKYLPLKIQGECLGNIVGKMRVHAHVAMCAGIDFNEICSSTTKKTLVFTSYVDVLQAAYKRCQEQKLDPVLIYANTNKNLNSIVKQFGENPNINPLIATYDSLSTAVPLTMADTMIMINAPFRSYIQEQTISRIHRLGQDSQTVVYQLFLDTGDVPNISSRSLDIMEWSQKQVELMTGVSSPYQLEEKDGKIKASVESIDDLTYEVSIEQLIEELQPKSSTKVKHNHPVAFMHW